MLFEKFDRVGVGASPRPHGGIFPCISKLFFGGLYEQSVSKGAFRRWPGWSRYVFGLCRVADRSDGGVHGDFWQRYGCPCRDVADCCARDRRFRAGEALQEGREQGGVIHALVMLAGLAFSGVGFAADLGDQLTPYLEMKAAVARSKATSSRPLPAWLKAREFEPRPHYWLDDKISGDKRQLPKELERELVRNEGGA